MPAFSPLAWVALAVVMGFGVLAVLLALAARVQEAEARRVFDAEVARLQAEYAERLRRLREPIVAEPIEQHAPGAPTDS